MSNFLEVADLGDRLDAVVQATRSIRDDPTIGAGHLAGKQVGLYFALPSLRTRVSTEVAVRRLGGDPVVLTAEGVGLGEREAIADVARVLSKMIDAIALRDPSHKRLTELGRYADIPVMNLLSNIAHPCQALADLATIADHRPIAECTVAYIGDPNNVARSLAAGVTALGGSMRIGSPARLEADSETFADGTEFHDDPDEAVAGADVVYTDVWVSMSSEDGGRRKALEGWGVDLARFGRAANDAIFLHCLPAHRGEEVASEVMEHPRSRVFEQAEYRLHSFQALLLELL